MMALQHDALGETLDRQPALQADLVRRWFIVQLKPGGSALAERNLVRQGFEVMFPRRRQPPSGRRPTTRMELLFPGYGFVAVASNTPWRTINNTYGVARLLLGSDRRPAQVPPGFMKALQARCEDSVLTAPPELAPGDQVRIAAGPFAELMARIERLEPLGRVTVLLDLLNQPVRVSLPAVELSPTSASSA